MTVHSRRIASVPVRTTSETWRAICQLVASSESPVRSMLDHATGLASMLIAEEYTKDDAIILSGGGPQLRFYTLHGDDALGDAAEELPVSFDPGYDWTVSLPCGDVDLAEAVAAAAKLEHFEVRALGSHAATPTTNGVRTRPVIDLAELERK